MLGLRARQRDWETMLARTKQVAEENAKLTEQRDTHWSLSWQPVERNASSITRRLLATPNPTKTSSTSTSPQLPCQTTTGSAEAHDCARSQLGEERGKKTSKDRKAKRGKGEKGKMHSSGKRRGNEDHGQIVCL